MGQASTIGRDIAKRVFQAHGADATGRVVFRKRLVRAKVLEFFAVQPPCLVALEACGGGHYWARELGKLGHTVRLGTVARLGVMPRWLLADADRWRLGSAARSRCRACRCRRRGGLGAAGRPRAGTSASAATWPGAG